MIAGAISYPGMAPAVSFTYTCVHGITPGTFSVRTQTGSVPDPFGTMAITDGENNVLFYNVKFERLREVKDESGIEWICEFSDERWQWREGGHIYGCYNQLDDHGKLIPRMIRSPYELCVLLLRQMNVARYAIDVPPGVTKAMGEDLPANGPILGQVNPVGFNFPIIGVNPPVNWEAANPAQALQELCDQLGRRVVYDPVARAVYITRVGEGTPLPPGSIYQYSPSVSLPESPDAIAIVGDRNKYEMLLELEAYGEEWNGQMVPIDLLSYTPVYEITQKHVVKVTCELLTPDSLPDYYRLEIWPPNVGQQTKQGLILASAKQYTPAPTDTKADILEVFRAWIVNNVAQGNVNPFLSRKIWATLAGDVLTITGTEPGWVFTVVTHPNMTAEVQQLGVVEKKTWAYSAPPMFANVQATERLTKQQAIALAQKHIWKSYALTGVDIDGNRGIKVPGVGAGKDALYRVKYKQNITLTDTMVQQIVPEKGQREFVRRGVGGGEFFVRDFYQGYSKSRAAITYGSINIGLTKQSAWAYNVQGDGGINTRETDIIPIEFSVVEEWQMITYNSPVFKTDANGLISAPRVLLQTGVYVRDNDTHQYFRYENRFTIRPGPMVRAVVKNDVQLNIIGEYKIEPGDIRFVRGYTLENDPVTRSNYYLRGELLRYYAKGAISLIYNGFAPAIMSGRVQCVTWSIVGGEGVSMQASENMEHDPNYLPYPARRRNELLRAVERDGILPMRVLGFKINQ